MTNPEGKEPEVLRCLVLSTSHMAFEDDVILTLLSDQDGGDEENAWRWIHETSGGFLIRMNARTDTGFFLRGRGISDDLCQLLEVIVREYNVSLIQFDMDGDVLPEFPVFSW
ncbi:hypothetical protein BL250_08790 [Erwinia sp. OLTSP20]|uniref:DUF5983 family protein n=1 Tax=unclassified Erwinia TaxID=2622719 RepID=UPI000C178094|nr:MULTISPECIES: DUF5983 family protein [unclassified Erwinia]PIJ50018.1 hypothetical protein BV501_10350 [Erwinia sp. OAMSP11]PIJ72435.1 hypothetical protein BK416_09445 [Erwinia sp. OLSSP12]PIJ80058.1 hypothetical protein BLD47_12015 [Erwinia sp. OLCASP19]PIJ82144.1 hypothetical protein BLD46_11720 [Erwinia sp. OLMTSP26]PIJ86380.1 hypothetical protein BLD49_08415 [Erwinia sp. OLMDSP33]